MAVACFAIIAESDTTTTPDQAIDLPAPADLAIVTPTPPNPDGRLSRLPHLRLPGRILSQPLRL